MTERIVIVGNGMAAVRLAERLVSRRDASRRDLQITVVGDEPHAPYNRILLSAVLEGTHRPEAITLRNGNWFAAHGIDLRLGMRVVDIHRDRKVIELADRSEIPYDKLVLATGAIPTLPPIRGLVQRDGNLHPKVHAFRSLDDCGRLLAEVSTSSTNRGPQTAIVIGGGLLGLQVARALSIRGLRVEIIEGAESLLHSHVDEAAGAVLKRSLTKLGTEVYTGARAIRIDDNGLQLDNGFTLDADLFVLTAGGRPSVNLARRAGLEIRRGIVIDDTLATTDEDIFAIGDCAQHDGRTTGFVPPAWEQAAILAARLTGGEKQYDGHRIVARLRATDLDVAVLGDPQHAATEPGAEVVKVSNPIKGTHKLLVLDDGVITAATLVGDLSQVGLITQAFDRGTRLAEGEPGLLLTGPRSIAGSSDASPVQSLPDDAEICACAGVSAGRIRACSSLDDAREQTRATTGCGGCRSVVEQLLAPARVKEIA
ncbi:FAD-dependent oxidoreductase [Nocardioides sp. Kera G14]|uniref:FAD-dependent oxidoreductase n=1 Tax=Nocardioides sp. Kera G14 TaxID=2884264 RepID=UPI001D12B372|nr:FAD-dependent oxidoreductase [Nocardioides sp. Kera G14]UDY23794.1 FAD-dependent oxidoreductase [Nocardioides sp. Kera G14]